MTTSSNTAASAPTTSDPAAPAAAFPAASALLTEHGPMDRLLVARALADPDRWDIRHVLATGSTNDDLAHTAGPASGTASIVLMAEEQTAGKGRSGRQWACPPGAGLMFSVKLTQSGIADIPMARRGWVGALLGLAVCRAFADVAGVSASLKWPNDVLVNGLKCGGILAEMTGDALIVGAGLNISLRSAELPRADATSLALAGAAPVDRNLLLAAILDDFAGSVQLWRQANGDVEDAGLRRRYLATCATIGTSVRVELPGDISVVGVAIDVDVDGAIILQADNGRRTRYSAGDVVHLRSVDPGGIR